MVSDPNGLGEQNRRDDRYELRQDLQDLETLWREHRNKLFHGDIVADNPIKTRANRLRRMAEFDAVVRRFQANVTICKLRTPSSTASAQSLLKKMENSFWIPKRLREEMVGDLLEDAAKMHEQGLTDRQVWWRTVAQILWLNAARARLWLSASAGWIAAHLFGTP